MAASDCVFWSQRPKGDVVGCATSTHTELGRRVDKEGPQPKNKEVGYYRGAEIGITRTAQIPGHTHTSGPHTHVPSFQYLGFRHASE